MARARTADPGWGRLSAQVVQHWPEALPTYLLPAAWMHAMGVESAHSTPGVRAFSQACRSAVARNDTNRREHEALGQRVSAGMLQELETWADAPYGCAAVNQLRRKTQVIGTHGEVAYWAHHPLLPPTKKPK